jgi:hypothetical protein
VTEQIGRKSPQDWGWTIHHLIGGGILAAYSSLAWASESTIFPEPPSLPTSEWQCTAFAKEVEQIERELLAGKSKAPRSLNWRTTPAPNCQGGQTYGPPEWARYEDMLCAAHRIKLEGLSTCQRRLALSRSDTAEVREGVQLSKRSVIAYADSAPDATISILAGAFSRDATIGAAAGTMEFVSATKSRLELASLVIKLFSTDTPEHVKTTIASDVLGKTVDFAPTGNPVSQLISSFAYQMAMQEYTAGAHRLSAVMGEFDRSHTDPRSVRALEPVRYESLITDALAQHSRETSQLRASSSQTQRKESEFIGSAISMSSWMLQQHSASQSQSLPPPTSVRHITPIRPPSSVYSAPQGYYDDSTSDDSSDSSSSRSFSRSMADTIAEGIRQGLEARGSNQPANSRNSRECQYGPRGSDGLCPKK